ncbi:hypothetical protein AAG906_015856 [Vitis piasezkii]
MPRTRSGNSYAMANTQNTNDQNPNSQNTNQPQLQHQIDQIATVLEQITHRLDVMDERYAREENGPFNRRGRRAVRDGERLDESDGDADHAGHRTTYQPLDELNKRMRVDVPEFFGKLEPNAFEDWLTAIEDYFDWFDVSEDRKVRYHGGEVWKNNYAVHDDQQFLTGKK